MSLEWTDILIIGAAVIGILLLLLCVINICYNLCRKKDRDDDGNSSAHHHEYRSGGYEYSVTPSGHFESASHFTHEKPTAYSKVVSSGFGQD